MNPKQLALILMIAAMAIPSGFAVENARNNSLLARVTVYWARGGRGADRYTRQHKSATGMRLHVGHCAVDPKKIPYGSRVVLPDGTSLAAVDTGSAVQNRKAARRAGRNVNERNAIVIDKFFETKQQALAWANSNPPFVSVKVVPPNAPAVAAPNLTNSQPIALTPPQPAKPASGGSTGAMTIATNAPTTTGPTGGIIRNPLGRLGR
jgi:3D (Asp-Asp-Asp) domain-containing protein